MWKLMICVSAMLSTAALAAAFPERHQDPLRGDASFTEGTRPPPLVGAENRDLKRVRSYAMQPPTIPHSIDNYQIDRFANRCMMCHARTRAGDTQATPISITHYQDREGNFLGGLAPRRYACIACHVPQTTARPLVENRFTDLDALVETERRER